MSKFTSWFNNMCKSKQKGVMDYNEGRLFNQISLLAKNRFRWEGLPEGIESHNVEEYLFSEGQCAFYDDPSLGLLLLKSNGQGVNIVGEPINFQLTGQGTGYTQLVSADNCVWVKSNDICLPSLHQVQHYTSMIDEIEKTMYMNLKQQRIPFMIPTNKENELSIKRMFNKVDEFEHAIFYDKRMDMGGETGVDVLSTKVPYLLKDLQEYKNDVTNEMLSWLGLNNTNNNKKERLLVDEVNVNNGHILMNLDNEYKTRKEACDKLNEMYGLNVKVVKVIDELEVKFNGQNDDGIKKPSGE